LPDAEAVKQLEARVKTLQADHKTDVNETPVAVE